MPSNTKVVVVEDDNDLQFLYRRKLEQAGFTVSVAADGVKALATITEVRPHLILLDLLLPELSGPEMLARLRAEEWASDIRVIVLTNISKDEAPPALRFLNVDRYVVKAHHTPTQVVQIVYEVLGQTPS
jgi:two-component system, OmpR family, response regulator AdeR